MKRHAVIVATVLLTAGAPAWPRALYKCTTAQGGVTYQEVPCSVTAEQKSLARGFAATTDAGSRRVLEADARSGDPLSRGFVSELHERESREREERRRLELEQPPAPVVESSEWMPPWGWAGPPGLARPKPVPVK